jgi:chromosome segregation ATPase
MEDVDMTRPTTAPTPTALNRVCDMLARGIEQLLKDVRAGEARQTELQARLAKVSAQTPPDRNRIEEVKRDLATNTTRLEQDRAQLTAFQEEHSASCGSHS